MACHTASSSRTSQLLLAAALASCAALVACTGVSSASASNPWARLGRPLHLPHVAPGSACPVSSSRTISSAFGAGLGLGPVYPVIDPKAELHFVYPAQPGTVWYPTKWSGQRVLWVARPAGYRGPVLIRGRRIDGPGGLGFGEGHVPSTELRLTTSTVIENGWSGRAWLAYTRLESPGCYAWQIDGTTFSTVVVFRAALSKS